jgi:hypothetical protein
LLPPLLHVTTGTGEVAPGCDADQHHDRDIVAFFFGFSADCQSPFLVKMDPNSRKDEGWSGCKDPDRPFCVSHDDPERSSQVASVHGIHQAKVSDIRVQVSHAGLLMNSLWR